LGVTQGDTEAEAREMAADALTTMIEEHIRGGDPLPRPSKPRGGNTG
jgi:predicted RNase H-like HicB family nuclease